jgi:mRNA-degrading endonuclease RelE of RelBE toxin-antitoxin system
MNFTYGNTYKKCLKKLSNQDKLRVEEALKKLAENPRHPSLNAEKLSKNIWSIRVSDKIRVTFEWDGDINNLKEADPIYLRKVGYHDVYRSP